MEVRAEGADMDPVDYGRRALQSGERSRTERTAEAVLAAMPDL